MRMHSPRRPGDMVGNMIEELEITVTGAAKHLGVTRQTLNNLINNDTASVSPEMAVRLEAVFGSTADNWLRMQANYDATKIRKRESEITKGLKRFMPSLTKSEQPRLV
ncbi:MAG: HigA family addiction module antidote protein [Hyphomicrobiales bacterium]|nr:HigA family addiction module antidote protein [Hyphomicrobiales bacterium]